MSTYKQDIFSLSIILVLSSLKQNLGILCNQGNHSKFFIYLFFLRLLFDIFLDLIFCLPFLLPLLHLIGFHGQKLFRVLAVGQAWVIKDEVQVSSSTCMKFHSHIFVAMRWLLAGTLSTMRIQHSFSKLFASRWISAMQASRRWWNRSGLPLPSSPWCSQVLFAIGWALPLFLVLALQGMFIRINFLIISMIIIRRGSPTNPWFNTL